VWAALAEGRVLDPLAREKYIRLAHGMQIKSNAGLASVASDRCDLELDKGADTYRLRYGELVDVPLAQWPTEAISYLEDDVRAHWQVVDQQDAFAAVFHQTHGLPLFADQHNRARTHWALHLSSLHGIATDPQAVAALDKLLTDERLRVGELLKPSGLVRANGSRCVAVTQTLLAEVGSTLRTNSGNRLAASAEALERLHVERGHPLELYRRYAQLQRLRTTYVKPMQRAVVRTHYNAMVSNGRTSSAKPNVQNLPQQHVLNSIFDRDVAESFRECFVPRPGHLFVVADLGKAEMVAWAQVLLDLFGEDAPQAALANALRAGRDVHDELLQMMGGGDRTMAKGGNFGLMGGMGIARFIAQTMAKYGVHLTDVQANHLKNTWLRLWGGQAYFDWVAGCMQDGVMGFVHKFSGRIVQGLSFTEGCNYPFSGRVADAANEMLWRCAVEMYTEPGLPLYGCRQVTFEHDKNVIEVPAERVDECAERLETVMVDVFRRWVPDIPVGVDVKVTERGW
jgi:hypothetical protein